MLELEEKIIETVKRHPEGLTINQISKELNIHRNTTSKYVFALVRSGILEQRRVGVASLCYLKKKKTFFL
jgi:DNA-binding IclR family transcriptional regulator